MPRPASNGAMANLTLTRVVFEFCFTSLRLDLHLYLTLTRVVFEF